MKNILNSSKEQWKICKELADKNDFGVILPRIALVSEIFMIPMRLVAGLRQPSQTENAPELKKPLLTPEQYYRLRAKRVDKILIFSTLIALLLSLTASSWQTADVWRYTVISFAWLNILNVLASVLHYGLFTSQDGAKESLKVLNLKRIVVLGFLNYLQIVLWYSVLFASDGTSIKNSDGHPLTPIYFSAITALTIGYGDLSPLGGWRLVAAAEGITGVLVLTILVGRVIASMKVIEEYKP